MSTLAAKVTIAFLFGTLAALALGIATSEYKAARDNTVCSAIQPNYP